LKWWNIIEITKNHKNEKNFEIAEKLIFLFSFQV